MSSSQLAQIVVPRPFRTALTYLVPPDLKLQVGARVLVPLAKQQSIGLVLASNTINPEANTASNLKPLDEMLDANALVDAHLLQFLQWAAEYYHHPLGEVIFHALPANLRKPKPVSKRLQPLLPAQPAAASITNSYSTLNLSNEQAACLTQLQIWTTEHKPILLHGITGSGKTEIYLRLMQPLIAQGKQVLMLVPEIGLTPQLLQRVSEFFVGISIVNLHSGLSDGERLKAWLQARNGSAQIIIGTRSAVFTPAPQLALIIIDEEHDASFKQQEGFHYHGRDLAIKRAAMLKIPLLLGTATPALETLQNVAAKRFHYAKLEQRPGSTRLPKLLLQDTRQLNIHAGLTPPSLQALEQTLARGEQAMVFLNRRGFAPTLHCPTCGWQASCPHCSVNLTYHARRHRLLCHHCGFEQVTPEHCPSCHNPSITTIGHGTERLEISLQQQFADYPVLRIDRDATQTKQALTDKLEQVYSNVPLILVGTQMLAKGHDFPNLTLVIILEIDQSLFSTDYRALERLGQLLIQVSGRAGRADKPGQVILQTSQPDNPFLHQLISQGYAPFAQHLLEARKRWHFPPFSYQALIRASHMQSMEKVMLWLEQVSQHITALGLNSVHCLGPTPAVIEKRANRYRAQLLLSSPKRAPLHSALYHLTQQLPVSGRSGMRWSIDIDPIDFT